MAYEIISQNNNTTTLSDGTNTITVPGYVNLATSTSYTISEVNNNTATLEGSDGSVIRDVPCVVVLAGGGSTDTHNKGYYATQSALETAYPTAEAGDYAIVGSTDTVWIWDTDTSAWVDSDQKGQVTSVNGKTGTVVLDAEDVNAVPQLSTMPVAGSTNVGKIVQFVGTTDSTYTNGYFYGCVGTTTPASTSETVSSSTMSNVTVNVAAFVSGLDLISEGDPETYSAIVDDILDGTSSLICSYMDDGDGNVDWCLLLGPYTMVYGSLAGVGITYSGAPAEGDSITVDYTPESTTYAWQQTDVQPQGDSLPSQTGNSGKFLTTDGTSPSWSDKPLQNTATGTDALTILGNPTATWQAINIGYNSTTSGNNYGVAIGANATASNSIVGSYGNISIGTNSQSTANYNSIAIGSYTESSYSEGIAIGRSAKSRSNYSISIGSYANSTVGASSTISIGYSATSSAQYAIQLGYAGNNSDANTFKVANANGNFEIMDANGNLPADRLASTSGLADGNYRLRLTMASGVPTLTWVAE